MQKLDRFVYMIVPGVLLKIWLKQGKEKILLARKKDCWQGFQRKRVNACRDKIRQKKVRKCEGKKASILQKAQ